MRAVPQSIEKYRTTCTLLQECFVIFDSSFFKTSILVFAGEFWAELWLLEAARQAIDRSMIRLHFIGPSYGAFLDHTAQAIAHPAF